mgnify:CR=1 FL=1
MAAANNEFFEALSMLEHERGITAEYLIDKIKAAIVIAVKKNYEVEDDHVMVEIDPNTGKFNVALIQDVVADEDWYDEHSEIGITEAQNIRKDYKVGDRVVVDPYLYCGHCYPCSIGRTNCCDDLHVLGVHVEGGMAEYFCHPADMLVKIPDGMSWVQAAMAEPLTISLHGIHRGGLKAGEYCAIIGAGPIGLAAAMVAQAYGAHAILLDLVQERLDFAKSLGVEYTINSGKEDANARVHEITGGEGAQQVMECSGANPAIRSTLDLVSHAGRITFTGWPKKETSLPPLEEGQVLKLRELKSEQKFTQPPARYTEATLIKALEENGIGRPSTYAPTVSTILDREYVVKEGKYLRMTPLGSVVNDLMCQRFPKIVDVKFTANMEKELDEVESGDKNWKALLREFYGDFDQNLNQVEKDMEGVYIKVPDEVSEEKCDICGRNMVVKTGRFGRFLACPGYPECTFTKPLVVQMPGRCPKCGGRLMKRTGVSKKTGKQYTYYCCERLNAADESARCDFMTWDVPVKDDCPVCGHTMFKKAGKGFRKPFCINPECANFLPEDKRGYVKKARTEEPAADGGQADGGQADGSQAAEAPAEEKAPAKKAAAKKAAAKKPAARTAKSTKSTKTTKTTKTTKKKTEEA